MKTPKKPPTRIVRLKDAPTNEHDGLVRVQVGRDVDYYTLHPVRVNVGTACELTKQVPGAPTYLTIVSERGCACSCQGFRFTGKCKHTLALKALVKAGKLAPLPLKQEEVRHDAVRSA